LERPAHSPITWIFHPGRIAGIEQNPRRQIECLLRAIGHNHLVGSAAHRPRQAQILRDCLPQRPVTGGIAIGEHEPRRLPYDPRGHARPQRARKLVQSGYTWKKGLSVAGVRSESRIAANASPRAEARISPAAEFRPARGSPCRTFTRSRSSGTALATNVPEPTLPSR